MKKKAVFIVLLALSMFLAACEKKETSDAMEAEEGENSMVGYSV